MKRDLLEILACPICKNNPLELEVIEERDGEIVEGVLHCSRCSADYPIKDSIPNMLPPDMR